MNHSPPHQDTPTMTTTLRACKQVGPSYYVLTFDSSSPLARPGQFSMLRSQSWGLNPFLGRPMSILRAVPYLQVLVKVLGEGTRKMVESAPGQSFDLQVPLGSGWGRCPDDHTAVLVGGGVGIAPLLNLAVQLKHLGSKRPVCVYGARSLDDLPLSDELEPLTRLVIATEDGSRGVEGLVTVALEQALRTIEGPVKLYSCGPHGMMAAVAQLAQDRDLTCEVSLEAVMACGHGVCLGCAVPRSTGGYLYACVDGPCVDSRQVAWSAS